MDTAVLVKTDREGAWNLLEELKRKDFSMSAAFWQYLSEDETWRLFIATKLVDKEGSIAAYSRLQALINDMSPEIAEEFSVMNISLIGPHANQVNALRRRYGKIDFTRAHIRRFSLSPEEAYVYFLVDV